MANTLPLAIHADLSRQTDSLYVINHHLDITIYPEMYIYDSVSIYKNKQWNVNKIQNFTSICELNDALINITSIPNITSANIQISAACTNILTHIQIYLPETITTLIYATKSPFVLISIPSNVKYLTLTCPLSVLISPSLLDNLPFSLSSIDIKEYLTEIIIKKIEPLYLNKLPDSITNFKIECSNIEPIITSISSGVKYLSVILSSSAQSIICDEFASYPRSLETLIIQSKIITGNVTDLPPNLKMLRLMVTNSSFGMDKYYQIHIKNLPTTLVNMEITAKILSICLLPESLQAFAFDYKSNIMLKNIPTSMRVLIIPHYDYGYESKTDMITLLQDVNRKRKPNNQVLIYSWIH